MQKPIIVFDSGRGGQSIYIPLKAALPQQNIIYLDDHEHFPYGDKSAEWLRERFRELAAQFRALNPLLVVLACNTATVNVVEELRSTLSCPVIGVEPVIKPLSDYSRSLVLMTASSAASAKTARLMDKYGQNVQVYTPKGLAEAIEYNDIEQVKKSIHEIKEIVQKQNIEAVGLSCTHYPLILNELQKALPETTFIDPSQAVVNQVVRVLKSIEHE